MLSKTRLNKKVLKITCLIISFLLFALFLHADKVDKEIEKLKKEHKKKGYNFEIGRTSVSHLPIETLCGTKPPVDWKERGRFDGIIVGATVRETLPSSFDWREHDCVMPVKNQWGCQTCWAFATAASYEGAIKINGGPMTDLSEQFLIDCNNLGYGVNGGWVAYEDLKNGIPTETCYPYTSSDSSMKCYGGGACKTGCKESFPVYSWSHVGSAYGIPKAHSIKAAIYTHGPVWTTVYVNEQTGSFQHYSGGIFNACDECPSSTSSTPVNHAVVLVGWNDDGGYWIMQNSWGVDWGEKGYMKIKYGCCNIGYGASYAIPMLNSAAAKK